MNVCHHGEDDLEAREDGKATVRLVCSWMRTGSMRPSCDMRNIVQARHRHESDMDMGAGKRRHFRSSKY